MGVRELRERNLRAFVGLIGEAMSSLAKRHEGTKHPWPDPEYVNELKRETVEGKIPLMVVEGSELSKTGGYITMGTHNVIRRNGVQIAEFIKEPSNLFNADGSINERMGAVLVHEYSHALQNISMKNLPENVRARVPIATIEHANQALAISIWNEMNRILTSNEPQYRRLRERLEKNYGTEIRKFQIDPEIMRYQDRVTRYPGAIFMAQHPEFFKEEAIEARPKEEQLMSIARDVARQLKAVKEKTDVPATVSMLANRKFMRNRFKSIDDYMKSIGKEKESVLKIFAPSSESSAAATIGFYARELKHLREISKLESMRERLRNGNLPSRELNALHDFAIKKKLVKDVRGIEPERLLDFAMAHKLGELEANRMNIREAAGVLGRRLKMLHDIGFYPEDKMAEIWNREAYINNPERKKQLREIRERARRSERGFSPEEIGGPFLTKLGKKKEAPYKRRFKLLK